MRCVIFVNLLILRDSKILMLLNCSIFTFHLSCIKDNNILVPAVDLSELLLYINYFSLNGHGKCLWRNIRFGLLLSLLNFFYTLYSDILILSINFFFWTATSTTPRFVCGPIMSYSSLWERTTYRVSWHYFCALEG